VSSLRDALLGAWELVSFVAVDGVTGAERHPLGTSPRGLILYTADGFMSAQLARTDFDEYVAYGGRFTVDEQTSTVHHDVTMSMMPELLAAAVSAGGGRRRSADAIGDDHGRGRHHDARAAGVAA
jgi:hypothetical protein